jgi:hypothetical protein
MQSRMEPGSQTRAALRPGHEKKKCSVITAPANLIPLQRLLGVRCPMGWAGALRLVRTSLEPMHRAERALRLLVRGQERKELGDPA